MTGPTRTLQGLSASYQPPTIQPGNRSHSTEK